MEVVNSIVIVHIVQVGKALVCLVTALILPARLVLVRLIRAKIVTVDVMAATLV